MAEVAKIILEDQSYDLPVVVGTENEKAIDIAKLRDQSGYITLDTGYKNTGATKSAITYLDGENGILHYRGYPIEQLAERSNFLEVAYLLIFGELPNSEQFSNFQARIKQHTLVHENTQLFFHGYPTHAHPMGILASIVCSMSSFYPESLDPHRGAEKVEQTMIRLLAKFPTIISWIHKLKTGHPFNYPKNNLDYTSNFVNMMFSLPTEEYHIDPVVVDALDKLLILHADHEQNCSTSTVRIVGSSQANLYASISAGICALWGPLHGGANQEVIEMLERIQQDGNDVKKWINKAKDKNDPFRLMGFGHRVYKNFDPRAKIIKQACDLVLSKLGIHDPVLDIAKQIEEIALTDDYFVERKLYPNVDFYSGVVYSDLGFGLEFFTPIFAVARIAGWVGHILEYKELDNRLLRPDAKYIGELDKPYVPLEARG